MSSRATFSQYAPENGDSRGFAKVVVSRQGACDREASRSADVTVRVGPVAVVDKQPGFARVDDVVRRKLAPVLGGRSGRRPRDRAVPRRGDGLADLRPGRVRRASGDVRRARRPGRRRLPAAGRLARQHRPRRAAVASSPHASGDGACGGSAASRAGARACAGRGSACRSLPRSRGARPPRGRATAPSPPARRGRRGRCPRRSGGSRRPSRRARSSIARRISRQAPPSSQSPCTGSAGRVP